MKKESEHIILVEPYLCGHHAMYLKNFANILLSMGYRLTIAGMNTEELAQAVAEPSKSENKISYNKIRYALPKLLPAKGLKKKCFVLINAFIAIRNFIFLRNAVKSIQGKIFFCSIDEYMHELLPLFLIKIIFPFDWAGLFLQSNNTKPIQWMDRRKLFFHERCKGIAVLGKTNTPFSHIFANKIVSFPDFTDESVPNERYELALSIKRKAGDRKIISLIGAMASRKGVQTFINSIDLVDSSQYFFVIAGGGEHALTEDERRLIHHVFSIKENCLYFPFKIPEEADFNDLIASSDIIYAAYQNFENSSNMFAKSSLFKKPLIVSRGFYMEKVVTQYRIGLPIEQNSSEECADAIRKLSSESYLKKLNPNFEDCLDANSIGKLGLAFKQIINLF